MVRMRRFACVRGTAFRVDHAQVDEREVKRDVSDLDMGQGCPV